MFTTLSYRDLLQQERARNLREHNQCHNPGGSSNGGQFCSKGGGGTDPARRVGGGWGSMDTKGRPGGGPGGRFTAAEILDATKAAPAKKPTGRAALSPAAKAAVDRFHTMGIFRSPDDNPYSAAEPNPLRTAQFTTHGPRVETPVKAPKVKKPKVEYVTPGAGSNPNHIANYRGMEIHTLPSYTTPYYFVNAPGFGSMQHSPSLTRIKNQINRFKDTGQTARGHEKAKGSARYQKRKKSRLPTSSDRKQVWWTEQD
jgi:hypothetical protein